MFLGWVIIVIILQQGPFQIMPAEHVGRPPMEYPPGPTLPDADVLGKDALQLFITIVLTGFF